MSSLWFVSEVLNPLVCCVVFCGSLFFSPPPPFFFLVITVFSVLIRSMAFDYPFGIFFKVYFTHNILKHFRTNSILQHTSYIHNTHKFNWLTYCCYLDLNVQVYTRMQNKTMQGIILFCSILTAYIGIM